MNKVRQSSQESQRIRGRGRLSASAVLLALLLVGGVPPAQAKGKAAKAKTPASLAVDDTQGRVRGEVVLPFVAKGQVTRLVMHWRHVGEPDWADVEVALVEPRRATIFVRDSYEYWAEAWGGKAVVARVGSAAAPVRVLLPYVDRTAPVVKAVVQERLETGTFVDMTIEDESKMLSTVVNWRPFGETDWRRVEASPDAEGHARGLVPARGDFEFYAEAWDVEGNGPGLGGNAEHPVFVPVHKIERATPAPPPPPGRWRRPVGWTLLGAGLVGTVAAAVLASRVGPAASDASGATDPSTVASPARWTLAASGALFAAGGIVFVSGEF